MFQSQYNQFARKFTKSVSYTVNEKTVFHRDGMKLLKTLAIELGIEADFRSNKGGVAVSGEITLHGDQIYIQLFQPSFAPDSFQFLVRSCKGRKDYSGGMNHFHSQLSDPINLVNLAKRILGQ
jgi:hypothetical protein